MTAKTAGDPELESRVDLYARPFSAPPQAALFRNLTGVVIILAYLGSVVATYTLIYLVAFGEASLSSSFMQWLGAIAFSEIGPLIVLLTRIVWGATE